jgi:thymidylate synthase
MNKPINYKNATYAFENIYRHIDKEGKLFAGTKAVFNVSFTLSNVLERVIETPARKFNQDYADYEFEWYLSGNRDAFEISEKAKIWKNMMIPGTNNVISNYGYFWNKNNQLDRMIEELKNNPNTRRAILVHYDIEELDLYKYDTPCNVALNFYLDGDKLELSVMSRSIDLWYGYGNDQYCFSKLMELVALKTGYKVGRMHWHITNLHLYEKQWNKDILEN